MLNELYLTARYTTDPKQREAAQSLADKLRSMSADECMDLVKDIQSNYKLPDYPRTVGEMIVEASGMDTDYPCKDPFRFRSGVAGRLCRVCVPAQQHGSKRTDL